MDAPAVWIGWSTEAPGWRGGLFHERMSCGRCGARLMVRDDGPGADLHYVCAAPPAGSCTGDLVPCGPVDHLGWVTVVRWLHERGLLNEVSEWEGLGAAETARWQELQRLGAEEDAALQARAAGPTGGPAESALGERRVTMRALAGSLGARRHPVDPLHAGSVARRLLVSLLLHARSPYEIVRKPDGVIEIVAAVPRGGAPGPNGG